MSKKVKIVMSDLHLGAGLADEGNALEDFHSHEAFQEFLAQVVDESEQHDLEMELIFAGDMLDFLQVPCLDASEPFDPRIPYPPERYASSSEEDSRKKMSLILSGHPVFFAALQGFVQASSPRRSVTIIKGNHDVNLHWLAVQDTLREALGAVGEKADCLAFEERRITREGIYVEHGHQYTERVNRFPDFEEPHDPDSPDQIYLPPGSRFVFRFYNDVERRYYWMDGIKPLTALIWYAFAFDFAMATRALVTLLKEAPAIIWGSSDREGRLPTAQAAIEGLKAQEQLGQELQDAEHMRTLEANLDQRASFYDRVETALVPYGVPRVEQGVSSQDLRQRAALSKGAAEEAAQRSALAEIAAQKRFQEKAQVIVFGHTHEACTEDLGDGAVYVNAGTWTWRRDFSGQDFVTWKRLWKHPEEYTAERRLTYVRIDYAEDGTLMGRLEEFCQEEPEKPGLGQRLVEWIRKFKESWGKRAPAG